MNNKINPKFNKVLTLIFLLIFLNQCGMGADARKYPPEPELRVKKNINDKNLLNLASNLLFIWKMSF